jgi:hypothetical protein
MNLAQSAGPSQFGNLWKREFVEYVEADLPLRVQGQRKP